MTWTIRRAMTSDLPAILNLYGPLSGKARASLSPAMLRAEIENPRTILLTAWEESGLAGFLDGAYLADGEAEIRYLAVTPGLQRRGAGRALVQAFKSLLKRGAKIYLEVAEDNELALAFYQAMGARKLYERKNYYKEETEEGPRYIGAWVMEISNDQEA